MAELTMDPAILAMLTGGGNPTASAITGIYDLISGLTGKDVDRGKEAAAAADPFASQRPQYQQLLKELLTEPGKFREGPGYKFALEQGQDAIRAAGARLYGTERAGALAPELAKYTEGYAAQNYDARINQLMQLAGVNSGAPGVAGGIMAGAFDKEDASLASGANVLGSLLDTLFGSGAPGGALTALQKLLGIGNTNGGGALGDFSGLTGGDFWGGLTTPGGEWGVDPGIAENLGGILSPPGATPIDLGGGGTDWITNTFGDLFGG